MKPCHLQHSGLGDIYTRNGCLDQLLLPMAVQRRNLDPVLQPFYPHRLDYQGPMGMASTVLKPVAVRLTNVYAGLPVSLSLLDAWGDDSVSRSIGKPASGLGFIPPAYDYHETANSLLTKLLSNTTTLHNPLSHELKELLHLREQLLQNRNLTFNAHSNPLGNETRSAHPNDRATSSFMKPTNPATKTKRHLSYKSDEVAATTKLNSVSENVQINTTNFKKNSKLRSLPLHKSRKHFMTPMSKSKDFKEEIRDENPNTMFSHTMEKNRNNPNQKDTSKDCPLSNTNSKLHTISGKNKKMQEEMNISIKEYEHSIDITSKPMAKDNADKKLELILTEKSRSDQTSPSIKKLFQCHHCRYTTDRKNNLKRHIVTMHLETSKTLECCGIVFQSKASLRDHNSVFHKGGYRCQTCSRNFCRKALLRRHLTVHSGQKDFFCSVCGYATSHKSNLERHHKVHYKKDSPRAKRVTSFRKKRPEENKEFSLKKYIKLPFGPNISQGSHSKTSAMSTKCTSDLESELRILRFETKASGKITKSIKKKDFLSVLNNPQDTPMGLAEVNSLVSHPPEVVSHGDLAAVSDKLIHGASPPSNSPSTSAITSHTVSDACRREFIKSGKRRFGAMLEAEDESSNTGNEADVKKRMFQMKYECSDCGRCFKLQTLLCLHELRCPSSQDIFFKQGQHADRVNT